MPREPPPPQEYARVVLIVILLFFLYSPDQAAPPGFPGSPRDYAAERAARARRNLDVLNSTNWQDFSPASLDKPRGEATRYLNLTGFRQEDGYAWERLSTFKKRSQLFSDEVRGRRRSGKDYTAWEGEIYQNITGIVTGNWVRYTQDLPGPEKHRHPNLTDIAPGVDWAFRDDDYWTRNVTGREGRLQLRIDEKNSKELAEEGKTPTNDDELRLWSGGLIRDVSATMTVGDESSSGDGWDMKLHGAHWPRTGVVLLTTTSDKFTGIFGLPHLAPSKDYYATSQKLLNLTLEKTVEKLENVRWIDPSNPWTSNPDVQSDATTPVPHCEFVVYVQVYPLEMSPSTSQDNLKADLVHKIEQELRFPVGAPIPDPPRLQMSTVVFSPDCGFILESKGPPDFASVDGEHLVGMKQEVWLHKIQHWMLVYAAVILGQIFLLKIQSKEASTPSTVGRVSLYTATMMLMTDALLFSTLSLMSATFPNIFPSALLASFAALMSVALGVRFVAVIYNVQEPERRERARAQEAIEAARAATETSRAATLPATVLTAAGADVVTPAQSSRAAPSNDPPIIVPSDQDIDAEIAEVANAASAVPGLASEGVLPTTNPTAATPAPAPHSSSFGTIYVQFVVALTLILFISLSAISWPVPLRTAYVHILSSIYLSFWVPQIRRNIKRNCRKALLWKFVVGQSILRLLPFAYFYLKEDNIIFSRSDPRAFCVLAGWVWIQILALVAQEILGPRWALPNTLYDDGWDYHPILKEDNVEAGGLPIGLVQAPPASPTLGRAGGANSEDLNSSSKKTDDGTRTVDCAICMQVLEVPVIASGAEASGSGPAGGGVVGMLARRQYMVTPCRHIFHSQCLEGWMRFRLQCPICRENLPPL